MVPIIVWPAGQGVPSSTKITAPEGCPGPLRADGAQGDPAGPCAHRAPQTLRGTTRPICPYPQVAKYNGTGSIDEQESFNCAAPR